MPQTLPTSCFDIDLESILETDPKYSTRKLLYCVKCRARFESPSELIDHRDGDVCHDSATRKYLLPVDEYLEQISLGELDDAQEMAVEMFVDQLNESAVEVTDTMITHCANQILMHAHEGPGEPRRVSAGWTQEFLERHPWFKNRYREPPLPYEVKPFAEDEVRHLHRDRIYWKDAIERRLARRDEIRKKFSGSKMRSETEEPFSPSSPSSEGETQPAPGAETEFRKNIASGHENDQKTPVHAKHLHDKLVNLLPDDAPAQLKVVTRKLAKGSLAQAHLCRPIQQAMRLEVLKAICEEVREVWEEMEFWKGLERRFFQIVEFQKEKHPEVEVLKNMPFKTTLPLVLCREKQAVERGYLSYPGGWEQQWLDMREWLTKFEKWTGIISAAGNPAVNRSQGERRTKGNRSARRVKSCDQKREMVGSAPLRRSKRLRGEEAQRI